MLLAAAGVIITIPNSAASAMLNPALSLVARGVPK
jgi:hypothetical protein